LRSTPSIEAPLVAFLRLGTEVQVLDTTPVRGYYSVASGGQKGWIWGANLAAPGTAE
jgi:uncharacterized protein YgiM (DUF1202 family)